MRKLALLCLAGLFALTGCTLSLAGAAPTPTNISLPTLTPILATATLVLPPPTATVALPTATLALPSPTVSVPPAATATSGMVSTPVPTAAGTPSGPYAVIRVTAGDVLNIRSAAGIGASVVGSFPIGTINVMRTGPSSVVDGETWVQVQNPAGGTGWVNALYLTEYVASATFCADGRVNSLLTNFGNALIASNGTLLASLVSSSHGLDVRLWRNGNVINFDRTHAPFVFESTYEHNWGASPASGLDEVGSFHEAILPKLLEVYNASYALNCNTVQTGGASYDTSWPAEYAGVNFYSLYKPGTPGTDLDWRTWLVGVEYVGGQPVLFGLVHLAWEP